MRPLVLAGLVRRRRVHFFLTRIVTSLGSRALGAIPELYLPMNKRASSQVRESLIQFILNATNKLFQIYVLKFINRPFQR